MRNTDNADNGFLSKGNVGIGTSAPVHLFDLRGTAVIGFYKSDNTYQGLIGAGDSAVTGGGANDLGIRAMSGNLLFASNGSAEAMRIMNGNVGIGTTSPAALLDMKGVGTTSATSSLIVRNSTGVANITVLDNGYVGIGTTAPVARLSVAGGVNASSGFTVYSYNSQLWNNNLTLYGGNGSVLSSTVDGNLSFGHNVSSVFNPTMYLTNTGNLGIGTASPRGALDVGTGKIYGDGSQLTGIVNGMVWNEVTGTSASMSVGNGYIANNAGLVTLTLPATASVGTLVAVVGKGAGGWQIAQNANGVIHFGNQNSTSGTGGYIASTATYDTVELICVVADNEWVVRSSVGNITVH